MFGKSKSKPETKEVADGITVTMEEIAPCQKSVQVQVLPLAIAPIRTDVVKEFKKESQISGFRKGKAPENLIQQKYAQSIQDETLHRATKAAFEQAAKGYGLRLVGPFEVSKADYDDGKGLEIEAQVEVEPEFELADYSDIKLKKEPITVSEDEKKDALKRLQESMAQMVPGKEGDEKERKVPEIDDDLAKDLGFESLEKLNEQIEKQLQQQKEQDRDQKLENDLSQELLKRHQFDVPESLVKKQKERIEEDFKMRMMYSGAPEDKVTEELEKFKDKMDKTAKDSVKFNFIIGQVAAQEKIEVTQDELIGQLWQLSQQWKKDPAEVQKIIEKEQMWPKIYSNIRHQKTLKFLLDGATGEKVPASEAAGESTEEKPD